MRRALGGSNKGTFVRSICGLFLSSYAFEGLSLSTEVIIEFFFLGGAKNEDFSKNCERYSTYSTELCWYPSRKPQIV